MQLRPAGRPPSVLLTGPSSASRSWAPTAPRLLRLAPLTPHGPEGPRAGPTGLHSFSCSVLPHRGDSHVLSVPQRAGVWLFPGWGCSESSCHEPRVRVSDSPSARGGSWGWAHWPRGDCPPAVSAPPRPCQRSSCLSSTSLPRGRGCLPAFSCVSLVASGEGTAGTPCARRPFPRLFSHSFAERRPLRVRVRVRVGHSGPSTSRY